MTPARRKKAKNTSDPRGEFAQFLRAWYDRRKAADPEYTQAQMAEALQLTERALRLWLKGESGPVFAHLDFVAEVLGYGQNWAKLAQAVKHYADTGTLK